MRAYRIIFAVFGVASVSCMNNDPNLGPAIFESQDGQTVLMVSRENFFLGPKDHPNGRDFLEKYGDKIVRTSTTGGECLGIGVFQIAKFSEKVLSCNGVRILRSTSADNEDRTLYQGVCYNFADGKCNIATDKVVPSIAYGYEIDKKSGLTKIFFTDIKSRNETNTLVLKSGHLLK